MKIGPMRSNQDDIAAAIEGLRSRLDTLASITADNILIPGGPQERYHAIVEEAYVVLGLIETQIDELRTELEWQHKRLMKSGMQRWRAPRRKRSWVLMQKRRAARHMKIGPMMSNRPSPEPMSWGNLNKRQDH